MDLHSHSCVRNFQAWISRRIGRVYSLVPRHVSSAESLNLTSLSAATRGKPGMLSACCDWCYKKRKSCQLQERVEDLITSYEKLDISAETRHSRRISSTHIWIPFRLTVVLSVTNRVSVCSRHLGDGEQMRTNRVLQCWPWTVQKEGQGIQYKRQPHRRLV